VIEVAKGELEQVKALVTENMAKVGIVGQLSVPMDVQLGVGKSWSEAAH
jgi:DNA polymerase-1